VVAATQLLAVADLLEKSWELEIGYTSPDWQVDNAKPQAPTCRLEILGDFFMIRKSNIEKRFTINVRHH
jgi:hypothetical protein